MDSFELKTYAPLFHKEAMEIVRWDKIDSDALAGIFGQGQIRRAAESLVNYFDQVSGTNDTRKKLGRYLYPAGSFDDMMLFLRCVVRAEGYEEMIMLLNQNFARANGYNDPLWIIWGRFLTDVFDMLKQWARCKDKVIYRMQYF